MKLLPRFTTLNKTIVKENNGEPYSTGYYDTHISRAVCCGKSPDLYSGTTINGFISCSKYEFRCNKCNKKGGEGLTPNEASSKWNIANKKPLANK